MFYLILYYDARKHKIKKLSKIFKFFRKCILLNETNFVIDKSYFDHSAMWNTVAQLLYSLVQFT